MDIGRIGGSSSPARPGFGVAATRQDAETAQAAKVRQEFLRWAQMTPAERMRANMLASLGVTEEELAAMEPEARKKIEDKLRELIREKVQKMAGVPGRLADITV